MKLVSWNVNGLRAVYTKGFMSFFDEVQADIFCLQEIKMQEEHIFLELDQYYSYYHFALKKGYSGTAVFTKQKPMSVTYGLDNFVDDEGRVLTLQFEQFFLVNVYTPNSKRKLERLDFRLLWDTAFREYICKLAEVKKVIVCGDLNVAHKEIDLANPKSNVRNAGFTCEERNEMSLLLNSGFVDSFRHFYPDQPGCYTWWSYMHQARTRNIGWRIDYFLVSSELTPLLVSSHIHSQQTGSDHCPIEIQIDVN